jgi:uncharacterized phage protein gp47/JayE
MPWQTPSLREVREFVRDDVVASLRGAALVGNNVLRVVSDAVAGVAHHTLIYIDWLAMQLLPDTAETEWLDRHGAIWLLNADGSKGRKPASYASGSATVVGVPGTVIPQFTELQDTSGNTFETSEEALIGEDGTAILFLRALQSGSGSNIETGLDVVLSVGINGIDGGAQIVEMAGGTDQETDYDLRQRILLRIQNPPMGGDAMDYVQWALAVNDVTRAWSYPNEMGIGTITVRFMMDVARSGTLVVEGDGSGTGGGFPTDDDVDTVRAYIDLQRPVAVKDRFVVAPLPHVLNFGIANLEPDSPVIRATIAENITEMLFNRARPGSTVYRSWMDEAISNTVNVDHYNLIFEDTLMSGNGFLPVLGTITYS